MHRPGHQTHVGTRHAGRAGNGKPHFSARQIGQAPDRINGLIGGASRHQNRFASQQLGRKERLQVFQNFFGLEHAAITGFAASLVTLPHIEHVDAIRTELRHIALGGRVGPHFPVHGWRDQQGDFVEGTGQAHEAEQFVGAAMQQFGHEIRTGRGHQNGICIPTEVDVGHVVGLSAVPLRGENRPARQGLHGHRRHEVLCGLGHHDLNRSARLDQGAAEFSRLEGSNAT